MDVDVFSERICHLQMAARLGTEGHRGTLTLLLSPHYSAVLTSHSPVPPVHFLQGGPQLSHQTCPPSALSNDFLPADYFLPSSLPTLFIILVHLSLCSPCGTIPQGQADHVPWYQIKQCDDFLSPSFILHSDPEVNSIHLIF